MLTDEQVDILMRLRSGEAVSIVDVPDGLWQSIFVSASQRMAAVGGDAAHVGWLLVALAEHERDASLARCAELEARAKRAEAAVKRICEIGARGGWCAVDSENWPCLAPRPLPEGSCLACWLSVADGGPSGIVATCYAEADWRVAEGKPEEETDAE